MLRMIKSKGQYRFGHVSLIEYSEGPPLLAHVHLRGSGMQLQHIMEHSARRRWGENRGNTEGSTA